MIVGLDPSLTATGLAFFEKDAPVRLQTIASQPGYIEPRLLDILKDINQAITKACGGAGSKPEVVVIESLSFGSNDPSAQERAGLHFLIRVQLYTQNIRVVLVPPSSLKKFVCGSGAAKKEHMLKAVFQRWSIDTSDNNQADAVGLAYIGAALEGLVGTSNEAQREVLHKLTSEPVKKVRKTRRTGVIS